MAVVYILSLALLFAGMMMVRKSEARLNGVVWLCCSVLMVMACQVFCGGVLGLVGVEITLTVMGIANLVCSALCLAGILRQGRQTYRFPLWDVVSAVLITGMVAVFALVRYGTDLHIFSASVDGAVHARYAQTVALEHRFEMNLFFTSLIDGLMMQCGMELFGMRAFDLYHVFVLGEILFTWLAAMTFWSLVRVRVKEEKPRYTLLPLLLTPLYWAGYPLYSTLFGFSYLSMVVCLITVLLLLLDQYLRNALRPLPAIVGMNLLLFGVFVSYTMFVPVAFFGTFLSVGFSMWRKDRKHLFCRANILRMLEIFLLPSALGMAYSYVDLQAVTPGGLISWNGGCYNDLYASFVILAPLAIIGIGILCKRREGTFILPVFAIQLLMMAVMILGLTMGKVSIYYCSKNNSVMWLLAWVLTAECMLFLTERSRAGVLFPFFFYGLLFMGRFGDRWIETQAAPQAPYRVYTSAFMDLPVLNSSYALIPTEMDAQTMELYRYVDEHCPQGEVVHMSAPLQSVWFSTLTGQSNNLIAGTAEDLRAEVEGGAPYVCACYASEILDACSGYLDTLDVVFENEAGRLLQWKPGTETGQESGS